LIPHLIDNANAAGQPATKRRGHVVTLGDGHGFRQVIPA